jgi:hypothetical protein
MPRLFALLPLVAALAVRPASSQVIRSYEGLDRSAGEAGYATFGLTFTGRSGNSDYSEFDLSGAFGYRGERHWLRFYPSWHLRRSSGETQENAHSGHLRHSYFFNARTRSFAFVQLQDDESLDVVRRFLLGGGIRRNLVAAEGGGVDLGVGVMWEEELVETGEETSVMRGTNLLVVNGTAGSVALTGTAFFQPLLDDWGDHRISGSGTATVPLGSAWGLDVSLSWRRDSRPPAEVEKDDVTLTVGIRFTVD